MTDMITNSDNSGNVKSDWVTPAIASKMLSLNLRSIYRLIEAKELVTNNKKHGQLISRESVEAARLRRIADIAIDIEFDQQEQQVMPKTPKEDNRAVAVMALTSLREERNDLSRQLTELHETRRQEALEIGMLRERVKNLEAQLQASQPLPQPTPAPEPAAPVTITPTAETRLEPVKRGFWARLLGG